MNRLSVTTRTGPSGPVVEMRGELDYHSAPQARDVLSTLRMAPGQRLLLDLGGLTFCDSSGISVMIALRNHALAARSEVALVAVPERIVRVFRVIGLEPIFPSYPTERDADDAWAPRVGD
ncbi:STAS domain-containing protein [Streptomyces sp. DT24]|uniref:STAS domain-containing protein n=1 Tax=unclassified Streptomyces TaxID=2593676 RepID=UPI0023B9BB14|nr:STAS domain-containing protein [Streptomyces sp. AM 4-1-1]WEH37104.1 STAS domain-containing protein [Streptomyces sp. AM 4-1-1]